MYGVCNSSFVLKGVSPSVLQSCVTGIADFFVLYFLATNKFVDFLGVC